MWFSEIREIEVVFLQYTNNMSLYAHLVAQKLIEVPQLIGIGDFPIQRGVPLLRYPRGTTDLDGGVAT